jgi:hypothetical protein
MWKCNHIKIKSEMIIIFSTIQKTDVVYVMNKKYVLERFSRENKYTCISIFSYRKPWCYTCEYNEEGLLIRYVFMMSLNDIFTVR